MSFDLKLFEWSSSVLKRQDRDSFSGRMNLTRFLIEKIVKELRFKPSGYLYSPTVVINNIAYTIKTYIFTLPEDISKFSPEGQIFLYDIGSYKFLNPENPKQEFYEFIKFVEIPFELVPKER